MLCYAGAISTAAHERTSEPVGPLSSMASVPSAQQSQLPPPWPAREASGALSNSPLCCR